jgi:hypothetical protein
MRYVKFRIRNFKGIKDATIDLGDSSSVGVYALVGLNESGKTTVLEAMHSFCPDPATSQLLGGDRSIGVPYKDRVPRHLISNFTGHVSVSATLALEDGDRAAIDAELAKSALYVDHDTLPDIFEMERQQQFEKGDYVENYFSVRAPIRVKAGKQKKWRSMNADERKLVRDAVAAQLPRIAYFPTFVFNFPEKIFLTRDSGDRLNQFYRQVFQDILDFDGKGHTIEGDIVRRIRSSDNLIPWLNFLTKWRKDDAEDKVQHVMDRAGAAVTRVIFGRWNKIFHEDTRGREVIVDFDVAEGQRIEKGISTPTEEHDLHVKFQIRDGTRRFDVNDRSLGFRWFFAFMLFTQFRVARGSGAPIFFLFDEPASNLHAAAQQKLIESFPEIAIGRHKLAYTTHSHYMIEPKWLEQTFIVTNRADDPLNSVVDAASLDDESLDVRVDRYRTFVNSHPSQTSYFQPILDRLEVVPSRFDIARSGVVVEGRSDYYVIRYMALLLKRKDIAVVPGLGAGTFDGLVALSIGWGLNTLFLLDGDKQGLLERRRYLQTFGLPDTDAMTLNEIVPGKAQIEDFVDPKASAIIADQLGLATTPSKKQLYQFFQERLAAGKIVDLGSEFNKTSKQLLDRIQAGLKQRSHQ